MFYLYVCHNKGCHNNNSKINTINNHIFKFITNK